MFLKFAIFLISIVFIAETSTAINIDSLIRENRLLKSEIQIAKKPGIYFIFNLEEKKVQLKARGIVLKGLPVDNVKLWGAPVQPEPLKLIKKSALLKPGRKKIKPGKTDEKDASEFDALEAEDMPVRYRLSLEDGVWLYVRPKPEGVILKLLHGISTLKSFITRPVLSFWNALSGRRFTEIDISLNEKDASALYWSFNEGQNCIIYANMKSQNQISNIKIQNQGIPKF